MGDTFWYPWGPWGLALPMGGPDPQRDWMKIQPKEVKRRRAANKKARATRRVQRKK